MSQLKDFPPFCSNIAEPDWVCAPVVLTPDSDALERANFDTALREFAEANPTVDYFEVIRFEHWAAKSIWHIFCAPGSVCDDLQADIRSRLGNCTCLDEDLWLEYSIRDEADKSVGN